MKHFPERVLNARILADELYDEGEVKEELRARLRRVGKPALARELGIGTLRLSGILRGAFPVGDDVAAALGFRRVMRFERVS